MEREGIREFKNCVGVAVTQRGHLGGALASMGAYAEATVSRNFWLALRTRARHAQHLRSISPRLGAKNAGSQPFLQYAGLAAHLRLRLG